MPWFQCLLQWDVCRQFTSYVVIQLCVRPKMIIIFVNTQTSSHFSSICQFTWRKQSKPVFIIVIEHRQISINICTAFVNKYTIDHNINSNIVLKSVVADVMCMIYSIVFILEVEKKSTDRSKCRRLSIVAKIQSPLIHDPKNRHFVTCFHCVFVLFLSLSTFFFEYWYSRDSKSPNRVKC